MARTRLTPKEIRARLRIDRDDLDGELVDQPELYHQAATGHILALSVRDQAKAGLAGLEGLEASRLRSEGVAISAAKDEARLSGSYQEHLRALQKYEDHVRKWEALREAVRMRGFVLRELVELEVARGATSVSVTNVHERSRRRD